MDVERFLKKWRIEDMTYHIQPSKDYWKAALKFGTVIALNGLLIDYFNYWIKLLQYRDPPKYDVIIYFHPKMGL